LLPAQVEESVDGDSPALVTFPLVDGLLHEPGDDRASVFGRERLLESLFDFVGYAEVYSGHRGSFVEIFNKDNRGRACPSR
jgi:hypothetical protein